MDIRVFVTLCSLLSLLLIAVPTFAAETSLTADDEAFLADMITIGIPMLYQTPEAMYSGVFFGTDTAIADIASKKSSNLTEFSDKIAAYTLGTETSALRDSWMAAAGTLKTDLDEYATLIPGCGSCISTMNAMYPKLLGSADGVQKDLISFYVKNQISP